MYSGGVGPIERRKSKAARYRDRSAAVFGIIRSARRSPHTATHSPHPLHLAGSTKTPKRPGVRPRFSKFSAYFFGRAQKALVGSFYEIRDQKFVDALIAAKKRGVDVKILVDDDSYYLKVNEGEYDKKKRNPFVNQLIDAGIEVRQDKDRSALMHNKFCVVDGRWVWSGSVNLTDTYATNANNGVEIESEVSWDGGGTSLYVRDPVGHSVELATPGVWENYCRCHSRPGAPHHRAAFSGADFPDPPSTCSASSRT